MGSFIPPVSHREFCRKLTELSPSPLSPHSLDALWAHFLELRRWSPSLSLIGPATTGQVLERHYGESLAGLRVLPPEGGRLLDLGSGAGFPGFVLAAAHGRVEAFLVEAQRKKWAFLSAAARRASVPCQCLHVRFKSPLPVGLPDRVHFVTTRAVRLGVQDLELLRSCLSPQGRILLWIGSEIPELPSGLEMADSHSLPPSKRRRILVLQRSG